MSGIARSFLRRYRQAPEADRKSLVAEEKHDCCKENATSLPLDQAPKFCEHKGFSNGLCLHICCKFCENCCKSSC